MRHLLLKRNNPPPMTVWQRRRARARAFLAYLPQHFSATVQDHLHAQLWAEAVAAELRRQVHPWAPPPRPTSSRWRRFLAGLRYQLGEALVERVRLHLAPPVPGQPQVAYIQIIIQIVIMIVAAIVAASMASKAPTPKPAAITEFDVPTAEEGRPIPKVFGEVWVPDPNVLWYGNLRSTPVKTKAGKK